MEDKNFTLEDVENVFKKYTENNQKVLEDKLKTFTPLDENKVKEIVSKKIMEFEVPVSKIETKTPLQTFNETIRKSHQVKK